MRRPREATDLAISIIWKFNYNEVAVILLKQRPQKATDLAKIFWTASEGDGFGYNDILNGLGRWRIWLLRYFEWPRKVTDLAITICWTASKVNGSKLQHAGDLHLKWISHRVERLYPPAAVISLEQPASEDDGALVTYTDPTTFGKFQGFFFEVNLFEK